MFTNRFIIMCIFLLICPNVFAVQNSCASLLETAPVAESLTLTPLVWMKGGSFQEEDIKVVTGQPLSLGKIQSTYFGALSEGTMRLIEGSRGGVRVTPNIEFIPAKNLQQSKVDIYTKAMSEVPSYLNWSLQNLKAFRLINKGTHQYTRYHDFDILEIVGTHSRLEEEWKIIILGLEDSAGNFEIRGFSIVEASANDFNSRYAIGWHVE